MFNWLKRFPRLSIKRKIFWGILTTSTLSIGLIFISTGIIMVTHHLDLTTTASMHELDYISRQLDFTLSSVENFGKTIAVNATVQGSTNKYNRNNDRFNQLDVIQLNNAIDTIIQSTPYIHSVSIFSHNRDLLATTDIASTEPSIIGIDLNERLWLPRVKMKQYDKNGTLNVLTYLQAFYSYDHGELLGYIEISIPETAIASIYSYNSKGSYGNQFIVDQYGFVQSTDGSYKLYQHYKNFVDIITQHTSGYTYINDDIVFYKYYNKLDWYFVHTINRTFFLKPLYFLILVSAILTLCGILVASFFSHQISKTITSPIYKLIGHIQRVIQGNWQPLEGFDTEGDVGVLYHEFNTMLMAQSKLSNDLIKEQKLKEKLSLDLLQQQVNPHFLYNALDNICALAEVDEKDMLIDIVMNLSQFYRETLNEGSLFITIGSELLIIESYLKIMLIRYYKKFDYTIECPDSIKDKMCLKLLLQPIIENSIYHGIKEMNGKGHIHIKVLEIDGRIEFTVKDNGVGFSEERYKALWKDKNQAFGIKNIDQRIKLYYGDAYGLEIKSSPNNGCLVTITISDTIEPLTIEEVRDV